MNFLKLKVVVWKNLIIRRRHWLLTTFESLLPVAIFFLIAYARSQIKGLHKIEVDIPTYNEPVEITYDTINAYSHLLYVPQNEIYDNIIHKVVVKFQLQSDRVKGFNSEEKLQQHYFKNANDTVFAIIFKGNNTKQLDYEIRYHDQYTMRLDFLSTGQLYSSNLFQYQQHRDLDYYWKGFLSLQKAIDVSFIESKLNKDVDENFSLYFKEFPYPPYKMDGAITSLFIEYLPLLTLFSFIFLCPAVLKRVVEEKQTGTKELLKMVGMESWMLWLGWFIYGMIPMLFSIILIVVFMKIPMFGTEYPPIEYSDGSVLFCFLLLYCMAANVFCFALSSCFSNPSVAMVTGILVWILSYFVPKYSLGLDYSKNWPWIVNVALNLLPNMALHYGYSIMSSYEERELGIQWSNIAKSSSGGTEDITMLNVFIMLLIDMVLYMLFTVYMDKVNPGQYGVRESLLFPLKGFFKRFSSKTTAAPIGDVKTLLDPRTVEEGHDLKKGIELKHVCKQFGKNMVVNNLNLDIYKNQITVLLGHNGAGKSTTMSMITGMLETTSGHIYVNGSDIKNNMEEIRSMMGLCPQHNLLFADLSVEEHLLLFAKLKGKSSDEASDEARDLLEKMHMYEKRNEMAHTLSGGMKRKLCLGMAVIGNSSVLILDEPSSGMDPESRRELWDLLLKWRHSKTILITTHFMEEADALGDWIAIMSDGHLECYGTPMFLKKKYDTGYHLSLMVTNDTEQDIRQIEAFVREEMPDSKFKSKNGKNVVFVLPIESSQISLLLSKLEHEKTRLGIENLSLTLTTLEDVFLRTNKDEVDVGGSSDTDLLMQKSVPVSTLKKEGYKRETLRLTALFNKRIQFFMKKKVNYLFPFVIALVFFLLTSYFSKSSGSEYSSNGPKLNLKLEIYRKSSVYVNSSKELLDYKNIYKQVIVDRGSKVFDVQNVENEILRKAMENIVYYKEHIITSAEFTTSGKKTEAYALYNGFALHSSPISLNLITNTMAKSLLGDDYSISTSNWPLETPKTDFLLVGYSEAKISLLWLVMVPLGCLFILGSFIIFPHTEINSNFVRLQYMCGVKHYTYWAVNLIADLLTYLLIMFILAAIICLMSAPFRGFLEFGILYFVLFLYGISGIPCTYLFCRKKTASGAFALLVTMGMFLGILVTLVVGVMLESGIEYYVNLARTLKILAFLSLPQVGLSYLLVEFARKAVKNYNMEALPKQMMSQCSFDPNPCCSSLESPECVEYKSYLPELDMWWLMLVSAVIFFTVNCILDSYYLRKCFSQFVFKCEILFYKYLAKKKGFDFNKSREGNRDTDSTESETLRAQKLFKSYGGKPVVRNISLKLNKQECMGILGVNGAGKTTTFRMLTRDECLDDGKVDLRVNDKMMDIGKDEYLESLGYCPQNDALNCILTGREILTVVANLRGLNDTGTVNHFLKMFELEKYADVPCGYYSGGNKRKLSLAVSLIGFPQFVLLDEPTNGVDPSSRRKFWTLIKRIQKEQNLSFILTSHSMVECEALCNSLKIMKNGEFKKEGSISELKREYGGFSVKLKLKGKTDNKGYDEVDSCEPISNQRNDIEVINLSNSSDIRVIKEDVEKTFREKAEECEIKDEHSRLLHYYIKGKNLKWSNIFLEFEDLKNRHSGLIEDYSISEASLEDVFLSVARNKEGSEEERV